MRDFRGGVIKSKIIVTYVRRVRGSPSSSFFILPSRVVVARGAVRCALFNVNGIRDPRQILHLCIRRAVEAATYQVRYACAVFLFFFFFMLLFSFYNSVVVVVFFCSNSVLHSKRAIRESRFWNQLR